MADPNERTARTSTVLWGLLAAILTLCVFQMLALSRLERSVDGSGALATRLGKVEKSVEDLALVVNQLKDDQGFIQDDTTKLRQKLDAMIATAEGRTHGAGPAPPEMPSIDFTQPEWFERARKQGAEYGIEVTKDEVRVPARFVLRQGAIEYFAVLKGGKEHETLISLRGNLEPAQRRPRDFATRLDIALQALGFKRGTPVQYTETGPIPPQGMPVYLFVEWEEKGEKVLVRAEDLIWDRIDERPMEHGKWVYVGSFPVAQQDDPTAPPVLAADMEGEAVATYNSRTTLIDNTSPRAADDTVYLVASPRLPPEDVATCTLVIRRVDREPTRSTWPNEPPQKTEPAPGPGPGDVPPTTPK